MTQVAPGATSDHAHNIVALSGQRRGVPERKRAERTSDPRLHIAMLTPPWIPVPPPGYGGIEFVVALLCDARGVYQPVAGELCP
jgi:hypothetical protein